MKYSLNSTILSSELTIIGLALQNKAHRSLEYGWEITTIMG